MNKQHTTITFSLDSKYNGTPLRNFSAQQLVEILRSIGNAETDVFIKDGDKVIAQYESKTANVYVNMEIKGEVFNLC